MPIALEPTSPPVEHRRADPDLRAVFEATCLQLGLDPVAVASTSREQQVVAARTRVAQALFRMGWTTKMLACVLPRGMRTFQRVHAEMVAASSL